MWPGPECEAGRGPSEGTQVCPTTQSHQSGNKMCATGTMFICCSNSTLTLYPGDSTARWEGEAVGGGLGGVRRGEKEGKQKTKRGRQRDSNMEIYRGTETDRHRNNDTERQTDSDRSTDGQTHR